MNVGVIWDLDDDPEGNVEHCAEHGVSKEEVEEVLDSATDHDVSRTSVPWFLVIRTRGDISWSFMKKLMRIRSTR